MVPAIDEPFGRTLIEAMLIGTPVVATASGGNVEAIRDGRNGLLVPPEDAEALAIACRSLLSDAWRYREIADSGPVAGAVALRRIGTCPRGDGALQRNARHVAMARCPADARAAASAVDRDGVWPMTDATAALSGLGAGAGSRRITLRGLLVALAVGVIVVGLFGRIMTFPSTHDELLHIVAARLIFQEPLYGTLGYNHLAGLPLLLGGVFVLTGTSHLLLAGRLLIFLCWLATAAIFWLIARRHEGGARLAATAILVLSAGTLLTPAGMLVTNNFLPVPFALLGVHLFIVALDGPQVRSGVLLGAGIALGFAVVMKISYVFLLPPIAIAALVVPQGMAWRPRFIRVLLPLVAGGIVGALPALVPLVSDPHMLFAHTVRYFTVGHYLYWEHSTAPKAMSLVARMLVAEDVWFGELGLLAGLLVGTAVWALARQDGNRLAWWPIPLVAGIVLLSALLSFAPTPAFPQYYEPPIPFLIMLFLLLHRQIEPSTRAWFEALTGAATVLALVILLSRIVPNLPGAARPSRWAGNIAHAEGIALRDALAETHRTGKVATLSPVVALEGGLPIYPEFGAGPFVYRVADYLPAADRPYFHDHLSARSHPLPRCRPASGDHHRARGRVRSRLRGLCAVPRLCADGDEGSGHAGLYPAMIKKRRGAKALRPKGLRSIGWFLSHWYDAECGPTGPSTNSPAPPGRPHNAVSLVRPVWGRPIRRGTRRCRPCFWPAGWDPVFPKRRCGYLSRWSRSAGGRSCSTSWISTTIGGSTISSSPADINAC